jgi:hypothetical protein
MSRKIFEFLVQKPSPAAISDFDAPHSSTLSLPPIPRKPLISKQLKIYPALQVISPNGLNFL